MIIKDLTAKLLEKFLEIEDRESIFNSPLFLKINFFGYNFFNIFPNLPSEPVTSIFFIKFLNQIFFHNLFLIFASETFYFHNTTQQC